MAIRSTTFDQSSSKVSSQETHFLGRVVRISKVTETRNHSDTLDYSDYRSTKCTYALVYLGRHGVPPYRGNGRPTAGIESGTREGRDLSVSERFAWVDCTGLFVWRGSPSLEAEVDSFDMQMLHGGPEMLEDLAAWDGHEKWLVAKAAAERAASEEARAAEAAKREARAAKAAAKSEASRAAANAQLASLPSKGTTVTVNGFTGTVFWTGVSKYRGAWSARAGVKDSSGNVNWISAEAFTTPV
jgi:hypothetical protein